MHRSDNLGAGEEDQAAPGVRLILLFLPLGEQRVEDVRSTPGPCHSEWRGDADGGADLIRCRPRAQCAADVSVGAFLAAIRRCMGAGLAPRGDAETVSLDLRTAVHGAVPLRVNQPALLWPPLEEQVDRFLAKLVGVPPAKG